MKLVVNILPYIINVITVNSMKKICIKNHDPIILKFISRLLRFTKFYEICNNYKYLSQIINFFYFL
jgi:hypothetical protein